MPCRIMILHPEGNLNNNPNLLGIVEILCREGYEVDIYSPHSTDFDQSAPCSGARFILSHFQQTYKNITSVFPTDVLRNPDAISKYIEKNIQPYDLIIGVDRGIIEASLIANHFCVPYGIISYEILFSEETGPEFLRADIEASRNVSFAVCQDRLRSLHLSKENKIPLDIIIDIPVAGRLSHRGAHKFTLHENLGIDRDKKIALYFGSISSKWGGIDEILSGLDKWPDGWVLVLHHRYAQYDKYLSDYIYSSQKKNIFLSTFSSLPFSRINELLDSVDLGVSFYLPLANDSAAGNNLKYIGMASGKTATYLQYGVPIILNEVGEMSEYTRRYKLGRVVNNLNILPEELASITGNDLSEWKENCLSFFQNELDLEKRIKPLLRVINDLTKKASIPVSDLKVNIDQEEGPERNRPYDNCGNKKSLSETGQETDKISQSVNSKYPKISVIIPSLNQGEFIEKTIISVLEQNYPNLECLVIDGGSEDNTIDIIKKYEKDISYWISEKDSGQSNAINKGIKLATGEIIAWLNSDDFYYPGALQLISDMYLTDPDAGLYIGNGAVVDRNGCWIRKYSKDIIFDFETLLKGSNFILQPSTFINAKAVRKVGLLDESLNYAMDLEYWLRVTKDFQVITVDKEISAYRWYDDIKTRTGGIKRWIEQWTIINKYSKLQITPGLLVEFFNVLQEKQVNDHLGIDITEFSKTAWIHFYKIMQNMLDTDDCIPKKGTGKKFSELTILADREPAVSAINPTKRNVNFIRSSGSKIKIDVILPEGHSWFVREGYVNALKYYDAFNRSFNVSPQKSGIELFEYLKNPRADFIFLMNTDWHAQYLHNDIAWKNRWANSPVKKILFSFECMNNPVVMKNESWKRDTLSAIENAVNSVDSIVFAHEIDEELFNKYGIPVKWQPFAIDEELFPHPKDFSERYNKAYFKGKTTPFYYEETYSERRKLIDLLRANNRVDLFDRYLDNTGSTQQRALEFIKEMNKYQITLCLPSLSPTMVVRPFEAMASGSLVLQNYIQGKRSQLLFEHNKNIMFYDENKPEELNEQINYLLDNPEYSFSVAQEGYFEVLSKHTIKHRVKEVLSWIETGSNEKDYSCPDPIKNKEKKIGENKISCHNIADSKLNISSGEIYNNIIIDGIIFQLQKNQPLGISRVWESLLTELARMPISKKIVLLDRGGTAPEFPGIRKRAVHPFISYNHTQAESFYLQDICNEENASLFISTYYTYVSQTHSAIIVHDLIPEIYGWSALEWNSKRIAISRSDSIICVSENSAIDLKKYYPFVEDERIFVVPNAASDKFQVGSILELDNFKKKHGITKPYFLVVGSRFYYKNVIQFVRAFDILENKNDYEILFVGGNKSLEPELNDYLADIKYQILNLNDQDLSFAYSGALALVYPSKYEGFGLPVLEAMRCCCPVITCKNSAIKEVAGDAAIFIKEDDILSLKHALAKVTDKIFRKEMISKGLINAKKFSWAKSADLLLSSLNKTTCLPKVQQIIKKDFEINEENRILYEIRKNKEVGAASADIAFLLNSGAGITDEEFITLEKVIGFSGKWILSEIKIQNAVRNIEDPYLLYFIGLVYFYTEKFLIALDYFINSYEKGLNHWRITYMAALSSVASEKINQAAELLKITLQLNPEFKQANEKLSSLETVNHATNNCGDYKKFKLSAIVSTFNSEYFIEGCLNDLVAQTLFIKGEMEIIVIDSHSEENEEYIVKDYQKKYPHIKYIKTEKREGIYKAWNRAIKTSQGKYLTNANTDDRHCEDALEKMADILDRYTDIELVYANDLQTNIPNDTFYSATKKQELKWSEFDKDLLLFGCFIGPHPVWRESLHHKYGYFDESLKVVGDYEFWLRISEKAEFFHLDEILGLYYFSEKSAEHRDQNLTDHEHKMVQQKYLIKYLKTELDIERIEIKLGQLQKIISNPKYFEQASKLLEMRRRGIKLQEAIQKYSDNEALLEDPTFLKKNDELISSVEKVDIIIDRNYFGGSLITLKAIYWLSKQNNETSKELFIKSLMMDPYNQTALQGLKSVFGKRSDLFVHCLLIISEDMLNQDIFDHARYLLERVLEYDFNNLDALNNLAALEIMNNNLSCGKMYIEKALAIEPENEIALNNLNYISQVNPE